MIDMVKLTINRIYFKKDELFFKANVKNLWNCLMI